MHFRYRVTSAVLLTFAFLSIVSAQRPIGTWRAFFPYNSGYQVEESEDRIYCASSLAIFFVEKSDNSIQTLDKASGLSDVGIRKIKYSEAAKTLVIAYQNSNIDLLVNGNTIYNMPEIKNKSTTSSKNINNITISGKFAYLATDLGVSVLDIEKREIVSTYVIGSNGGNVIVNDVHLFQDKIAAATDEGVKIAQQNGGNLQDFNNWILQTNGIRATKSDFINSAGNNLMAEINDSVFMFDGNSWSYFFYEPGYEIKQIRQNGTDLWVALWDTSVSYSAAKWKKIGSDASLSDVTFQGSSRPQDILADGKYWIADLWGGLMKYENTGSSAQTMNPNGPASSGVFNMAIHNDILYLAAGGTDEAYIGLNNNRDGIVFFKDDNWTFYNGLNGYGQFSDVTDNLSVAVNTTTKKVYWASYSGGVTEYDYEKGDIKVYNQNNSILEPVFGSRVAVSALTIDRKGNVWMMNSGTTKSLKVLTKDGAWYSFALPYSVLSTRKMYFDSNGVLWMCQRGGDIILYDPGDDIASATDDQFKRLSSGTGNGALPNINVWAIIEDKLGDVWVGTDEGIGTFFCASSVMRSSGCDADRIKVERDGFIGYLLGTEIVKTIAVDGGNRKWVGTTNGLYLISEDGKQELQRFTKDNSPLPANYITDIKINPNNGEVFIGTELGLVSYQGDATEGGEKKGDALVYPNPVYPDYDGPIAIKGLVDQAYVKITDAAGTLVYQGKANGGQMIWNGKGYNGDRAKSGVYIVYAATDQGKERSVAKIVLLN